MHVYLGNECQVCDFHWRMKGISTTHEKAVSFLIILVYRYIKYHLNTYKRENYLSSERHNDRAVISRQVMSHIVSPASLFG